MFLYMFAFQLTSVIEQAFFVRRACMVNHNYSAAICDNLGNYTDIQKEVQVSKEIRWELIPAILVGAAGFPQFHTAVLIYSHHAALLTLHRLLTNSSYFKKFCFIEASDLQFNSFLLSNPFFLLDNGVKFPSME